VEAGIDKLVFSSTCATYGLPQSIPMSESHHQLPINPYGRSKLIVEQILMDLDLYQGFRSVILRYFNAAGADPKGRLGEWHSPETHAVPIAIETALGQRSHFEVLGTDYDTRDGTCVRDFVHVLDLADAHTRAIEHLLKNGMSQALNLGTGHGTTVKELLATVQNVTGIAFDVRYGPRRQGDAPVLVADNALARRTNRLVTPSRPPIDHRHGLELALQLPAEAVGRSLQKIHWPVQQLVLRL
jgi:UDP-glucose 4-epimerase